MLYKTIVLQLLEQNPQIYEPLRRQRQMLPALEYYANELKTLHQAWKEILVKAVPGSDPDQIASEALEQGAEGPGGSFALQYATGRERAAITRRGDGLYPSSHAERVKHSRGQRSLFDQPPVEPEPEPPSLPATPPAPAAPTFDQPVAPSVSPPTAAIASGDKAKARDIIAAIRTLKKIETEQPSVNTRRKANACAFLRLRAGRPIDLPGSDNGAV